MLQTLERTNIFDARVLTAAHADALRALAGPGGLPRKVCPSSVRFADSFPLGGSLYSPRSIAAT